MSSRRSGAEIDERAAEWTIRVDQGPLSSEDQAALDTWLAADIRHLGAFTRARAMLVYSHRARALGSQFDPDSYAAAATRHSPEQTEVQDSTIGYPTRRQLLVKGASAAILVAVATGVFRWPVSAKTYKTMRGEIRLIPLEDGSSITLNTASEVGTLFDDRQRMVFLKEGEALFDVAKDRERPFIVEAEYARVRALGTSFTVRRLPTPQIQIVVQNGVVALNDIGRPDGVSHRLPADTRTTVTRDGFIETVAVDSGDIVRQLAWREGMLSFEDVPLAQAAAEFARYSNIMIRFGDAAVGAETVTGRFAANDPIGFCDAVALSFGLHAERSNSDIFLRRSPS